MRLALRRLSLAALAAAAPAAAQVVVAPPPADAARRDSLQTFAGRPRALSHTTPPGGDTVGYWQQRADYRVIARLDERREVLEAQGTLTYVNQSPDTLRELFLHQHLNAFRPGSRWSAADAREGRVRFQTLREPAYAFERFTRAPAVDGAPVAPEYPGGSDSSVVRLALPRPLGPGDSAVVAMAWEARPSTIPRRQARRGRSYDFAQWYPKVAAYDRGGWQPHALVPAGEFYGEFGAWDVTLLLADDQVVGATGVPVEGDPGWARVSRSGPPRLGGAAYGAVGAPGGPAPGPRFKLAAGERAVRFVARDVHHFGWSASPDYRYEGATYVRAPGGTPNGRARSWDTVGVHALYRPGDTATWGGGRATARTAAALRWLEFVYGPYGYPQMTVLHRVETGGTEFPMVQMNGSASQSLVLHEGGHIYSYGLLANNEWQRGWMDEGLTSYQTAWALGEDRHAAAPAADPDARAARAAAPAAERAAAARRLAADSLTRAQVRLVREGRAEPLNRRADLNAAFGAYSQMVYNRGAEMYAALRDVLGARAFGAFLRDYYARWAYRHVDDLAMRASAERAAGPDTPGGRDLGWFFKQWLGRTGAVDYAMRGVRVTPPARAPDAAGGDCWRTEATLVRAGDYRHPMPVGVRTARGWAVVRGDPHRDRETLVRYTRGAPLEVRLDPLGTTEATTAAFYVWRPGGGRPPGGVLPPAPRPAPAEARADLPSYATAAECVAAGRPAAP